MADKNRSIEATASQIVKTDPTEPYEGSGYSVSRGYCGSGFDCGRFSRELESKVNDLERRLVCVEDEKKKVKQFFEDARKLVFLQQYLCIGLFVLIAIVLCFYVYLFKENNIVFWTLASLVGIALVLNGFYLPNKIKMMEGKMTKIEERLEL